MSEYEVNVKVNVDSSQIDEVIEKVKQLAEAIEVVKTVDVTAQLSMDSKYVAQELYHSQLAKSLKTLDARKITIGELDVSRIRGTQ